MEKEYLKQPIEVKLFCDYCGEEMEATGGVLLSDPPQYVHVCPKCNAKQNIRNKQYPYIKYEDVEKTIASTNGKTSVYKQVKEELKNKPLAFYLNENERKEYDLFRQEHKHCECMGTIGGKISIIFTPTGLGDCITVKCNSCGKEKEITDVSNW